jgi:hypothetical protein
MATSPLLKHDPVGPGHQNGGGRSRHDVGQASRERRKGLDPVAILDRNEHAACATKAFLQQPGTSLLHKAPMLMGWLWLSWVGGTIELLCVWLAALVPADAPEGQGGGGLWAPGGLGTSMAMAPLTT